MTNLTQPNSYKISLKLLNKIGKLLNREIKRPRKISFQTNNHFFKYPVLLCTNYKHFYSLNFDIIEIIYLIYLSCFFVSFFISLK